MTLTPTTAHYSVHGAVDPFPIIPLLPAPPPHAFVVPQPEFKPNKSELVIISLLFGAIWEIGICWDGLEVNFDSKLFSLLQKVLPLGDLSCIACTFLFLAIVDCHFHFFLITWPSPQCCCRSIACTLTSSDDILTQQMLPAKTTHHAKHTCLWGYQWRMGWWHWLASQLSGLYSPGQCCSHSWNSSLSVMVAQLLLITQAIVCVSVVAWDLCWPTY